MTPKQPKKVWKIHVTEDGHPAGAGKFWMVDHEGEMQWSPSEEQSRMKMAAFAFGHGADEVKHDYDLIKYDT